MTPMDYLILKLLHIIGAAIIFGTGLGTAFHFWLAHLSRDTRAIAGAGRSTVIADWIFTAPAVVLQPVTGALLARESGIALGTPWLAAALALYALAAACWIPVVVLQTRMARDAAAALRDGRKLPLRYRRASRLWFCLGWPAFAAVLAIFFLMIVKPEL
jgi:uncharacterized membrane protein